VRRESPFRFYLSAALIVALFGLAAVTAHVDRRTLRLWSVLTAAVAPLDRGAAYAVREVAGVLRYARALSVAARENEALRAQVRRLQGVAGENQYLRAENLRLSRLLGLARSPLVAGHFVAAELIARSPASWFSSAIIDRGRASGVAAGDAVLAVGGLVGQVLSASRTSAVVLLLTDPESGIPILDVRTGDDGVLNGQGPTSLPEAQFFSGTAHVRRGDLIVTSGLGGGIPRGLVVGRVTALTKASFGLVPGALVAPSADLDALDAVLVVTAR
jgi:rod shape-determining protein MreC